MNYFNIYATIHPKSNKKPKNIWYFAHLFVPLHSNTGTQTSVEGRCDIVG